MRPRALTISLLFLPMLCLAARLGKTSQIDDFCQAVRNEFVEAVPRYYAGPDPWVALDQLPDSLADVALASVYGEGTSIKWMILQMEGPDRAWFETTQYFFDEKGLIKKRERSLDDFAAHIQIREEQYFQYGKIFKTEFHHTAIGAAKEDWDGFKDPNAPFYSASSDLPAIFLSAEYKRLAVIPAKIHPSGILSGWPVLSNNDAEF